MKTDIEIAQSCEMKPIGEIAAVAGVDEKYLELYGRYKAKVDYALLKDSDRPNGKLILVTAINPTPAGEGKTTTTVGLSDAMRKIGKNTLVALREPSLGPVFGVKGGAAGGGWAQVVPWRISISILQVTSMPSEQQTIFWQPCWITTFSRATLLALTSRRSPGSAALI